MIHGYLNSPSWARPLHSNSCLSFVLGDWRWLFTFPLVYLSRLVFFVGGGWGGLWGGGGLLGGCGGWGWVFETLASRDRSLVCCIPPLRLASLSALHEQGRKVMRALFFFFRDQKTSRCSPSFPDAEDRHRVIPRFSLFVCLVPRTPSAFKDFYPEGENILSCKRP